MKTSLQPAIPTTSIGTIATDVLTRDRNGVVLAVFRRSFYVKFSEDLVCVGPPELESGPLNLLYARGGEFSWSDRLSAGAEASCRSSLLTIGSLCSFDCSSAEPWQPVRPGRIDPAAVRRGLSALAGELQSHSPGGIGPLIAPILTNAAEAPDDALGIYPAIRELRTMLFTFDRHSDRLSAIVSQLVGLGPGLTPSGDDMLGGLMAGLNFFGHADAAAQLAAVVLPAAAIGTSIISNAHLRAASGGRLTAPLWDAVSSIGAGGGGLAGALQRVAKIGHSSGWDTLAGAALAADAVSAGIAAN